MGRSEPIRNAPLPVLCCAAQRTAAMRRCCAAAVRASTTGSCVGGRVRASAPLDGGTCARRRHAPSRTSRRGTARAQPGTPQASASTHRAAHLLAEHGAAVHLAVDVCAGTEFHAEELVVADVCSDERPKVGRPHRRRGGMRSWPRKKGAGSRVDGARARARARWASRIRAGVRTAHVGARKRAHVRVHACVWG